MNNNNQSVYPDFFGDPVNIGDLVIGAIGKRIITKTQFTQSLWL